MDQELQKIAERYDRRKVISQDRYAPLKPDVLMSMQERERAIARLLNAHAAKAASQMTVLEVGCGSGANLQQLLRLGFSPENLLGNDLIPERIEAARRVLPSGVRLVCGDACEISSVEGPFDIILQSTVFSSILDPDFQKRLAEKVWSLLGPEGVVLWYDLAFSNPKNPDVIGVPVRRIRALFPKAKIRARKITLAPPIARRVSSHVIPWYSFLSFFPFLRSHLLCWIRK